MHHVNGQVMGWMEQCAYIAASRVGRGGHLLTGSMDSIAFIQPTRIGDIMYISSMVRAPEEHPAAIVVICARCKISPAATMWETLHPFLALLAPQQRLGAPAPVVAPSLE